MADTTTASRAVMARSPGLAPGAGGLGRTGPGSASASRPDSRLRRGRGARGRGESHEDHGNRKQPGGDLGVLSDSRAERSPRAGAAGTKPRRRRLQAQRRVCPRVRAPAIVKVLPSSRSCRRQGPAIVKVLRAPVPSEASLLACGRPSSPVPSHGRARACLRPDLLLHKDTSLLGLWPTPGT